MMIFMPFPQMTIIFYFIEKSMFSIDKSKDTECEKDIHINCRAILANLNHSDSNNKIRVCGFSHGRKQNDL